MKKRKFSVSDLTGNLSFHRWATGESTPEEAKSWSSWVEYSEENRRLAIQAQKLITGIHFDVPVVGHREEDWQKIKADIDRKHGGKVHLKPKRRRGTLGLFLKVAAVVLICATAGLTAMYIINDASFLTTEQLSNADVTIITDYSEKKTISLTDGSEIILAAGSRLTYKENWLDQQTLRVVLEEGEAYFSIEPDQNENRTVLRFEVVTQDGITTVMGTKFSVTTYGEGARVVLEQGEVQVTPSYTVGGGQQDAVTLQPGEMAQWSKLDPIVTRISVNPRVYTSWVSDYLYFDDTPLSLLVDRIERTYGVDVEVEDPTLLDLKLSGALDFYGLEELTGAISEVLDIQLHHTGSQVLLTK